MAEKIFFPDKPAARWVGDRDCVEFFAVRDERKFVCLASIELLMERFGARGPSETDAMRAYEMNRARVQDIARAQILARNVTANNEVLLTTDLFAFKEARFETGVRESPFYFRLVRQITAELEEISGASAGLTTVEWERVQDTKSRVLYLLTIRDFVAQVSVAFSPDEMEHSRSIRTRLYQLWGDLLQDRNHKQLEEIFSAKQEA